MTVLAGTIWGQLRTSHLYAVFKGPYVYFGETGHVPPVRWKGHLTSEADFIGKLRVVDPKAMRKIARRAIEAELHQRFSLDPTPITPASELLSTPPSVPVRHKFGFDKTSIAKLVYEMIAVEYQKWLKQIADVASVIKEDVAQSSEIPVDTNRA